MNWKEIGIYLLVVVVAMVVVEAIKAWTTEQVTETIGDKTVTKTVMKGKTE